MSAVISPCGMYRYRLDRSLRPENDGGKVIAYFGINPSTADAQIDDATVRKWKGFTLRNGGERFIVGNVFSYRATDVKELARLVDTVPLRGDEHSQNLRAIIAEADILVPCWGAIGKLPMSLRAYPNSLLGLLLKSGKPIFTFGLTNCGQPRHPLMLAYDTPLIPWAPK